MVVSHEDCLRHEVPDYHIERPERLHVIMNLARDLAHSFGNMIEICMDAELGDRVLLEAIHDSSYLAGIERNLPNHGMRMPHDFSFLNANKIIQSASYPLRKLKSMKKRNGVLRTATHSSPGFRFRQHTAVQASCAKQSTSSCMDNTPTLYER